MMRLKSKLLSLNSNKAVKVKVYSPKNMDELRIPFKQDKIAKVVGKLASIPPPTQLPNPADSTQLVTGVLVQNDFKLSLMAPEDLREYAGLTTTTMTCKERIRLSAAGIDLIKWGLEGTFGKIEELPEIKHDSEKSNGASSNGVVENADEEINPVVAAYRVMGCVAVRYRSNGEVELEWEGNLLNDGIADSVLSVLLSVESSPAAVKRSAQKHSHSHSHDHADLPPRNPHANLTPEERLERLFMFLEAQFGADNVSPIEEPKLPPLPKDTRKELIHGDASMRDAANGEGWEGEEEKEEEEEEGKEHEARKKAELERLHRLGIPVPGVAIKVDKMFAKVWLEDLEVECGHKAFADRVRSVVDRAVEVTAPLWA
jgi:cleavage and polyadenylation specificity factor subunit 3